jgi:hypothetical protein
MFINYELNPLPWLADEGDDIFMAQTMMADDYIRDLQWYNAVGEEVLTLARAGKFEEALALLNVLR